MLIYVFGIFVPLVVANGLVLRSVLRDAEAQQAAFLLSTIENIEYAIRREFEPIELVSEFVFADTSIYRILNRDFTQFEEYVDAHRTYLVPALTKYANVFAGISRISIYTENPILRVSAGYLRLDDIVRSSEWYRRSVTAFRRALALAHVDRDPRTELQPTAYLSLFRDLDRTATQAQGEMILRIDVNPAVVLRHLDASQVSGRIEVVDSYGTSVASAETPLGASEPYEFRHEFGENGTLAGWAIEGVITPVGSAPPWTYRWTLLLVVSGLSIAFSSLFVLLLSRSVTSRLSRLGRQMHRVASEDFSPIEMSGQADDEIGELIRDYNIMARKIESLIRDRYKAEIENHQLLVAQQQAQLDALQSQVNPHFLFNVLESVRMKSAIRGERETAAVIKRISRSIRRLTSWDHDLVSIREELEFTREYVEIQQYRFGERFSAEINVDGEVEKFLIPKLTIQGLVENACVHGLEPKTTGGTVRVGIRLDQETICVCVRDDGIGCDAELVQELLHGRPSSSRHIGIANIHRRLQLHFGDRVEFVFSSRPGEGTSVDILLRGVHEPAPLTHS